MVVRREDAFAGGVWQGIRTEGVEERMARLRERAFFMPRAEVEEDASFQQIIPYAVFRHGRRYLLTRRLQASSEKRLRRQYSLGLGGHINPPDHAVGDPIIEGLRREFEEEVVYRAPLRFSVVGLLNDDSSAVSRVHLGVVFIADGDSGEIRIRETRKLSGELLTLDQMRIHYLEMESWSQLVYDHLLRLEPAG